MLTNHKIYRGVRPAGWRRFGGVYSRSQNVAKPKPVLRRSANPLLGAVNLSVIKYVIIP